MDVADIDSRDTLASYISSTGWPDFLYFWGHTAKEGHVGKHVLSQWWPVSFTVDGVKYATAEHFMMAKKAALFGDDDVWASILSATTPAEAKRLGRAVKGFNENDWAACRFDIACRGNLAKFSQHAALRKWLVATADAVLVEASPDDSIWGIGLSTDSNDIHDPDSWRGLNLLGFALMKVRRTLRAEDNTIGESIAVLSTAYGKAMRLQSVDHELADKALEEISNLIEAPKYYLSYRSDLIITLRSLIEAYDAAETYPQQPTQQQDTFQYTRQFQVLLERIVQRMCDPV
jgi:ribA/ribD-fused uncharacterized protein